MLSLCTQTQVMSVCTTAEALSMWCQLGTAYNETTIKIKPSISLKVTKVINSAGDQINIFLQTHIVSLITNGGIIFHKSRIEIKFSNLLYLHRSQREIMKCVHEME